MREARRLIVLENKMELKIRRSKREGGEVVRKLHSEERHDLRFSPEIIVVVKVRRMGWEGHVARMRLERNVYTVLVGTPEGNRLLALLGVTGWIILKCILRKYG